MMTIPEFKYDLAVIGLGYVGLPLATAAANAGLRVLGVEKSKQRLKQLSSIDFPFHGLSEKEIQLLSEFPNLLTDNTEELGSAAAIAVCVPTPVDEAFVPDLSFVIEAAHSIGRNLKPNQLVILESTVAPGTTEGEFLKTLEERSGLKAGTDFNLAYSPERIDPGNRTFGLKNTPKIVGGYGTSAGKLAQDLYMNFVDTVVIAKGTSEAEAAKLLENTYRHINIALVNEFALACRSMEIDVFDVIDLAATKPFGFARFTPSAGAGGHCIPVDPNYFSAALKLRTGSGLRFIELANQVNRSMPIEFAELAWQVAKGNIQEGPARILVMGLTYKSNVADARESPATALVKHLLKLGSEVEVHDPLITRADISPELSTLWVEDLKSSIANASSIVLLQMHDAYNDYIPMLNIFSEKVISPLAPSVFEAGHGFTFKV